MDGNTMEQVRHILMRRWKQIGLSAAKDTELALTEELIPHAAEMIDMAQSLEQLGRDTTLAERERQELLAIERALDKLSSGSFGVCEDCSEEIPHKRLLVVPQARLCAQCQAYEERQLVRRRAHGA